MSDTFTLDVSQAAEIKHAAIRAGATNADLKVLSSGDTLAKILPFLRGQAEIVVRSFLTLLTTVKLPAQDRFVARDHFKVDTSDKAKVKIAFIWDDFKNYFLNKVELGTPEVELALRTLNKGLLDKDIRAEIGEEKEETTLSQFWAMLTEQGSGQDGYLLTNGYANILYIRDTEGTLWAVRACWSAESGGWGVDADSVQNPHGWGAGDQVVSRN